MINSEHQWVSTDEAERIVPVRFAEKNHVAIAEIPQAKRLPAALIGISIIALAGMFFVFKNDLIPAQLTVNPDDIEVAITDNGVVPKDIMANPGETITWINSATIPHILKSETLRDNENKLLESSAIFPGSEFSFTLGSSMGSGEYDYMSQTSPLVIGKIIVEGASVPVSVPVPSAIFSASSVSSAILPPPPVPAPIPSQITGQIQNSSAIPSQLTGTIPQNPFTIGNSTSVLPSEAQKASSSSSSAVTVADHKPITQPETGMGSWIALLAGFAAFTIIIRVSNIRNN